MLFRRLSLIPVLSGALFAQSQQPQFDFADVHPSEHTANPYTFVSGGLLRNERYDLRKATLLDLIRIAWAVDPDRIVGGPAWLELDRFDVSGVAPQSTSPDVLRLMLQSLLADRFQLAVHKDTRPLPAFALTLGQGKPNLREVKEVREAIEAEGVTGAAPPRGCRVQPHPAGSAFTVYSCRNVTMQAFAEQLRGMAGDYLRDPVVDSTSLPGLWDFDLKWNPRALIVQTATDSRTTIFDAIEQQLGLSLQPKNLPAPVLVVDRANEKPAPNPPGVAQHLPARPLAFDVANIKLSAPDETGLMRLFPSGRFEMRAFSLKILIATAWDVDWDHIGEVLIGAPKWLDAKQFDIVAKTAPGTQPSGTGFIDDDVRLMLRNLLIDRFKMVTHYEDRPVPAYTLIAAKPKLRKADPANRSRCREARVVANDPRDLNPRLSRLIQCQNVTMAQFARQLQSFAPSEIPNEVADSTGIAGAWDFTLNFTPGSELRGGANDSTRPAADLNTASDPNGGISLFDAINRQLGLKLELRKRQLPAIVIDHIEDAPTDN